jgi:uncharacterized membrane protein
MDLGVPLHPLVVHGPIVLLVMGVLFELAGRALDTDWWRKAAFAMLILGTLGAFAALITGNDAEELAEKQGVSEQAIEAHEDLAKPVPWVALAAVIARALAGRAGALRGVVSVVGLLLHLGAAVLVGVAAHRGGVLVYQHGAGVQSSATAAPADGSHRGPGGGGAERADDDGDH